MKDVINDCFVDWNGRKPTQEEIEDIIIAMPEYLMAQADEWGWQDTLVREEVSAFIGEHF